MAGQSLVYAGSGVFFILLLLVMARAKPSGLGVALMSGVTTPRIGDATFGVVARRNHIGKRWWCSVAFAVPAADSTPSGEARWWRLVDPGGLLSTAMADTASGAPPYQHRSLLLYSIGVF
jgi:hypothetical protein